MKLNALLFAALLFPFTLLHAASSNSTGLTIKGKIKAGSCMVNGGQPNFSVDMGSYSTSNFRFPGDFSGNDIPFQIILTRCPLTTHSAKVTFEGSAINDYLALDASSVGSGVAVAIYNEAGTLIPLASLSSAFPINTVTGIGTLKFIARFVALSVPVQAGSVQATATFTIDYF